MSSPVPPLISTSTAGLSGIMHLPRMWLKILLSADGRLAEGYRCGGGGFDQRLFEHFGVDEQGFIAYVKAEKPDYQAAEKHFLAMARDVSAQRIAEFNAIVVAWRMSDPEVSRERRERFGIADATFENAIDLNNLDDWAQIHAQLATAPPR